MLWGHRQNTVKMGGKTLIDPDVRLNHAGAFLTYLPRAAQIAFLSPFPSMWSGEGSMAVHTVGRRVLGTLTVFHYLCLAFLAWGLWNYRKKTELWLLIIFNTYGLLIFALVLANIGTLIRIRYGFYMLIVGIGFSFTIQKFMEYGKDRKDASVFRHSSKSIS
jgi:hypothetical protein